MFFVKIDARERELIPLIRLGLNTQQVEELIE